MTTTYLYETGHRFVKDFRWPPKEITQPENIARVFDAFIEQGAGASASLWRSAMLLAQMTDGEQLWVSKEVTDDLQASSIDEPDFASVMEAFPSRRLEVVFEDKDLPGMLMSIDSRAELIDLLKTRGNCQLVAVHVRPRPGQDENSPLLSIMTQDSNSDAMASVAYSAADMNSYVASGEDPQAEHSARNAHPLYNARLTPGENAMLRLLASLVHKIGLFIQSEGGSPAVAASAPTKAEGGKPGFKGRPKQKRWRLVYLPAAKKAKTKASADERKSHAFKGRHGFFRTYRHERFVTMRGLRVFIHPIPGPDGKYPPVRKFVVR